MFLFFVSNAAAVVWQGFELNRGRVYRDSLCLWILSDADLDELPRT